MRAAVIFGLGTSPSDLKPFQASSPAEWLQGLPASSSDANAVLILGGDGTIHRHLSALVRLQLPVLIVPAGSGNDFARALNLRSTQDSLRVWRDFESGKIQARAIDLGVIVPSAAPERTHYFCGVAGCGLDSAAARRANQMPRWLRGHGGYALALLPLLIKLPAYSMRLTQSDGKDHNEEEKLTLLAAGIARFLLGLHLMGGGHSGWIMLSGLLTFLFGLVILVHWPTSSLYVLGIVLGVDLIQAGVGWIHLGSLLKRHA